MTIKQLIEEQKKKSFTDPSTASDQEALGILISQYFKWDGKKIFETSYNAFEDSNFHSFNEQFESLWNKMNHELAHKFDIKIQVKEKQEPIKNETSLGNVQG